MMHPHPHKERCYKASREITTVFPLEGIPVDIPAGVATESARDRCTIKWLKGSYRAEPETIAVTNYRIRRENAESRTAS